MAEEDKLKTTIYNVSNDAGILRNTWMDLLMAQRCPTWPTLPTAKRFRNNCQDHSRSILLDPYIEPVQRTLDGQIAYKVLYKHFLGPNNVDNMALMADDKLQTTICNGEQWGWDFNVHKSQHSPIMEGLVKHGYTDIGPRSKLR